MMDVSIMINNLSKRLGDSNKNLFTDDFLIEALTAGQLETAQNIHRKYLTELEALESNLALSSGSIALSGLANDVLDGEKGILKVKIYGGKYCKMLDVADLKLTENYFDRPTTDSPYCYVFQSRIYVLPSTVTRIDVMYLKMPTDLVYILNADEADSGASKTKFDGRSADSLSSTNDNYNDAPIYHDQGDKMHVVTDYVGADLEFTVSPAAAANFADDQEFYFILHDFDDLDRAKFAGMVSELNPALQEIIISMAEATCWKMDGNLKRRDLALDMANLEMDVLNSRYRIAEGVGIKTVKNRR